MQDIFSCVVHVMTLLCFSRCSRWACDTTVDTKCRNDMTVLRGTTMIIAY